MTGPEPCDRPLHFVVGKGGVGKTTVASALAVGAARREKRVLVVEMDLEDRVSRILGLEPSPAAAPREILPHVFRASVEGKAALEEYLSLVIPIRRVLRAVFESKIYQHFVAAAPGLKELMTIGKVWYEVDQKRWDVVIVDCPATGHGLQYLRMPKVAYETFTTGLVHREAKRVWSLLTDPEKTAVSVVTTAEEMPVNETLEICRQLRGDLALPEGWLFVNRFHAPDFTRENLARAKPDRAGGVSRVETALVEEILARAEEEVGWAELNESYRRKLASESGWRIVTLPFLFREEFGLADVERLAGHIAAEIEDRSLATERGRAGGRR